MTAPQRASIDFNAAIMRANFRIGVRNCASIHAGQISRCGDIQAVDWQGDANCPNVTGGGVATVT